MLTIRIDPGLSGALAVVDADGKIELLADLPVILDRSLAWIDGATLQWAGGHDKQVEHG